MKVLIYNKAGGYKYFKLYIVKIICFANIANKTKSRVDGGMEVYERILLLNIARRLMILGYITY